MIYINHLLITCGTGFLGNSAIGPGFTKVTKNRKLIEKLASLSEFLNPSIKILICGLVYRFARKAGSLHRKMAEQTENWEREKADSNAPRISCSNFVQLRRNKTSDCLPIRSSNWPQTPLFQTPTYLKWKQQHVQVRIRHSPQSTPTLRISVTSQNITAIG